MIASIGHIALYTSSLLLLFLWFSLLKGNRWSKLLSVLHLVGVSAIVICIYYLIFSNQFQYYYVWHHSSLDMPFWYKVSCLWEGQEGSFLLWAFWNSLIFLVLIYSRKPLVKKALLFLIPIQLFLFSMIWGFELSGSEFKIGSSLFSLLKDNIQSEVYAVNPNFVPSDGTGLNALLQNYWMVIHPPIIFLGFALSSVPFAFCLGGLLEKNTAGTWVKSSMPWMIAAVLFVGMGMVMGAYWAYETLNFGGYWNWDPVENAIYIPWLIQLAALHLMLIFLKKGKALSQLSIVTIFSFLLVLYATFLTRSGVLGDTSVHSFTDLGLSGQLLLFLLTFLILSLIIYFRALQFFPKQQTSQLSSFEFWMSLGVVVLILSAFQVLIPTSFPVINKVASLFNANLKLAPPADQVSYYTNIQLWFAIAIMVLALIGQVYYWKSKMEDKWTDIIFIPVVITTVIVAATLIIVGAEDWKYIPLLVVGVFAIAVNLKVLYKRYDSFNRLGGGLSHLGMAIMVVGVLFSQGYKKVLTEITQFDNELNRAGNALLVKNKPIQINEYEVTYTDAFYETEEGYEVEKVKVQPTFTPGLLSVKQGFKAGSKKYLKGDEIKLDVENSFYRVNFISEDHSFSIQPRVQYNSTMGVVASPDVDRGWFSDIYTHVSNFPDPKSQGPDWSKAKTITLKEGEELNIGSKKLQLKKVEKLAYEEKQLLALKAKLLLTTADSVVSLSPVLLKGEEATKVIAAEDVKAGVQLIFQGVNPESGEFSFAYLSSPMDWITIKSIQFPLINLVWLGAILIILGMALSLSYWAQWSINWSWLEIRKVRLERVPIFKRVMLQFKSINE